MRAFRICVDDIRVKADREELHCKEMPLCNVVGLIYVGLRAKELKVDVSHGLEQLPEGWIMDGF